MPRISQKQFDEESLKLVKDLIEVQSDDGEPFFNKEWLIANILRNDEYRNRFKLEERRKKIEKICQKKIE
jgi:hypothetical protein